MPPRIRITRLHQAPVHRAHSSRFYAWLKMGGLSLAGILGSQVTFLHAQSEQATRYHEMLLKRPQTGLVLDRFIGAWLETGTPASLATFLKQRSSTAADLLVLALFHEYEGQEQDALKAYTEALTKDAQNASAWLQRAKLEARLLEFEPALKSLDQATAQKPEADIALEIGKFRGRLLMRTGRTEEALKTWQTLLASRPEDEDLAEEVIELQLDEALFNEAANLTLSLIERSKDASVKVTRRLMLGDILMRNGKQAEALKVYGEALVQSGQDTWVEREVLAQIEIAFRRGGDLAGLLDHLEKIAKEHPQRTGLIQQRARLQAETGAGDKALATYQELLQRTPGQRELRETYLDLLTRQQKYAEAITQTKLLQEQNPTDGELHLRLASLHQKQRDIPAAKTALGAYLAQPGIGEYEHLRVARLLENWELKTETKAAYETLVKAFPESPTAKDAQAHYLHRTGEREPALAIWRILAKTEDLDPLLAVAQALTTRQESSTAREILHAHQKKWGQNDRFLTASIAATLTAREVAPKDTEDAAQTRLTQLTEAVPWALERVRLSQDSSQLDDAIRQATDVITQAAVVKETMGRLGDPKNLKIQERALLSALQESLGETEAAEQTLRSSAPQDLLAAQGRLVRLLEKRQDWPRAAIEAEKLMDMPEGRTSANAQRLVDFYQRAGEPEKALAQIPDWKALSPSASQPWLIEAQILGNSGKAAEAIKVLRTAVRKFEEEEVLGVALATALNFDGQSAEAQRIYLRFYETAESPDEKKRWVTAMAQAAYSRGELSRLLELFKERQQKNREDAMAWLALAEIHRVGQNESDYRKALEEASRLQPRDVGLLLQLARAEEESGQWQQSLRTLEKAAALDTSNRSRQQMAAVHLTYGDENTGYRMLFEIAGGSKMDPKDVLRMADAMAAKGDWARLKEFLEPLSRANPKDYRLAYFRAVALEENGQTPEAIQAFLAMIQLKEELPEITKATTGTNPLTPFYMRMQKAAEESLPPNFKTFMTLMGQGVYQSYYHQYVKRYNVRSNSGIVRMPNTLTEVPSLVAHHLIMLSQSLDAARAAELWQKAAAAGLPNTQQLKHLQIDISRLNVRTAEDAMEKSGWDPLLLAYDATRNANELSPEAIQRVYQIFGAKNPSIAFPAAIIALRNQPELGSKWMDQILDVYEKSLDAPIDCLYPFSQLLGGGQRINESATPPGLTQTQKGRFQKLLIAILRAHPADATRVMPFAYVANSLVASEGWKELITLLEEEIRLYKGEGLKHNAAVKTMMAQYGGSQQSLLESLPFPVAIAFPGHLSLWLYRKDIYNPNPTEDGQPDAAFAGIKPFLGEIKHPLLRMALAYKADELNQIDKELSARANSPDATQVDYLQAAAIAQRKDDHVRAVNLMIQALALPMEKSMREDVDAALLKSILLIPSPTTAQIGQGVQSVRRLRTGRMTPQQRDELIAAMTSLKMTEEAAQWSRIAAMTPAPAAPARSASYSSSSSSRIQTLISQGNQDAAVRETVKQLQTLLQSNFLSGNTSYAKSETKKLISLHKVKDARKMIIEKLNPGDQAPPTKRREFAGILEMLEESPKAQEIYETLLEANPRDEASLVRLMIISTKKDPKKAGELLQRMSVKSLGQGFGEELTNLLNNSYDMELEPRLGLTEAIAQRLEQVADEVSALNSPNGALDWAGNLPSILANSVCNGNNALPYLHGRTARRGSSEAVDRDSPKMKRLIEAHQRLCQALMKHPSLADIGFSWYACSRLQEKGDAKAIHDDLAQRAEGILKEAATLNRPPTPIRSRYGYSREITAHWNPTPVEFLLWRAWKEGASERIEKELLPLAEKTRGKSETDIYRLQTRLWAAPAEEFASLASSYAKVTPANANNSFGPQRQLMRLIDHCVERQLPGTVLDSTILATQKTSSGGYSTYYYLPSFLAMRQKLAPEADMDAFLKQWLTATLGPESNWEKRMNNWVTNWYSRGGNSNDRPAYNVGQTLQQILDEEGAMSVGLKLASMTGLTKNEAWLANNIYQMRSNVTRNSSDALAFLEAINAFSEVDTFMTLQSSRANHPLTEIIQSVRGKPAILKELREAMAKRQPRTFGTDMVEAMLKEDTAIAASQVAKKRAEQLKTVRPERVATLTALFKSNIPSLKTPETADPDLLKALAPLLSVENAAQISLADNIVKATKLSDLNLTDDGFEDQIPRLMHDLVNGDREKAKALFLQGAKLIEAKASSNGWGGDTWTMGWTYRSELVDDFNDLTPGLPAIALAMQLCHEDDTGMLILDGRCEDGSWGQTLADTWRKAGGNARPALATDDLLITLQKELGHTPPTLLALGFYEFFAKLPAGARVPVLKAALKEDPGNTASLRAELAAAARLFLSTENSSATNETLQKTLTELGGTAPAWTHYRQTMLDKKLNPRVRIALAAHLCRKELRRPDAEVVRTAMALVTNEHREFHAVSGSFHFPPLARAYCRLPLDEAWKTAANEQWEAWLVRNSRNNESTSRNRAYTPREEALCAMLGITARLGREEAVNTLLNSSSNDSLEDDPTAFLILVSNGAHTAARLWLENHWETFLYDPAAGIEFTQALAEELPKFAAACTDRPDLALLGEMICVTLKDPPKPTQWTGFTDRNKRVMALVPRLKPTRFADESILARCLEHTSEIYETYVPLKDQYDAIAAKADVLGILELGDTWKTHKRMKPTAASLAMKLWEKGESADLTAKLEKLAQASTSGSHQEEVRAYTFSYLAGPVLDYLAWHWGRGDKCDLLPVIAFTDKVIACAPRHEDCYVLGTTILLKNMLHASLGDSAAYTTWQKGLKPAEAETLKAATLKRNTFFVCAGFFGKPKPKLSLEDRHKILLQMMTDPWVQAKFPSSGPGVPNLIGMLVNTHKLITLEELPTSTPLLEKAIPRKGRTAAEAGDLLAQNGKAEGLALYDFAIQEAGSDLGLRCNYTLRKTDLLERLNRQEEARKLLTTLIQEPKMGPGLKRNVEASLKRLK